MPAPTVYEGKPLTNVAEGRGGVERNPDTIHAHTFPGASDPGLLRNAVSIYVDLDRLGDTVTVEVKITNDRTGHHVPTDSPLRHMILLVRAFDAGGQGLDLLDGETLPAWCGEGDPASGYYAGLPGKAFAKILTELWTETSPSGAYWNPTMVESDNRLAAFASDTSRYTFSAPKGSGAVSVVLIFRRAFKELADWKGWDTEDIVMEQIDLPVPTE